jgi:P-type Cu+ transporter
MRSKDEKALEEPAFKDPVCGMTVSMRSPHVAQYERTAVYFCRAGCKAKFLVDAAKNMIVPADARVRSSPGAVHRLHDCGT